MSILKASGTNTIPISVIIPCFNYGKFVGEIIDSVKNQTLKAAEIILVDDGSTDNTRELCENLAGIKYIWKPNGGVSSARNEGYRASRSEYIIFPDADDILKPTALEKLWEAIRKLDGSVGAIFGKAEMFSSGGKIEETLSYYPLFEDIEPYIMENVNPSLFILSKNFSERLIKGSVVPQCSAVINRKVYDEIGDWDENFFYHQDRDIWVRIALKYRIGYLNETIAGIRRHDNNITHEKNWFRNHHEILEILKKTYSAEYSHKTLKMMARKYYANGAYNMAQRYFAKDDIIMAKKLMRDAFRHNPKKIKAFFRLINYEAIWIFSRKKRAA
jgi:glycosyltransferase involved in cell wall biosynthesis